MTLVCDLVYIEPPLLNVVLNILRHARVTVGLMRHALVLIHAFNNARLVT